ncbi:MAG: HemK/PrmC family methyltransferase [Dissulfurispiraceae bacterium]|jgi:release factor glutamine methyltransferase
MNAITKMKEVSALFEQSGIEDPAREAEMLVTGVLDIDRAGLYAGDAGVPEDRANYIDELAVRRTRGEPIQYLIGHVLFYGLKIHVGSGVLIPRPETELLVEEAIKVIESESRRTGVKDGNGESGNRRTGVTAEAKDIAPTLRLSDSPIRRFTDSLSILDLCTGSGCIALALARHFPEAIVYGVDASEAAMVYATQNAVANDIHNVGFRLGNLFEPVSSLGFDCIVSNPPYVRHDEIKTLQREIKEYEPLTALDGGRDGLDFYRRILREAPAYLRENGTILLEAGFGQSDSIRELAMRAGFTELYFTKDFAGIERVAAATLASHSGER